MLYIYDTACISPQETFSKYNLKKLHEAEGNLLKALEPTYENLPANALRRMSKSVRMSIGAALQLLNNNTQPCDGIILGTGNASMEETGKFLDQIMEHDEGILSPANFVLSSPNAPATQISQIKKNKNYNITHVHKGHAFENAVIDALMFAMENPEKQYLLGGVDECSTYHFNLENQNGLIKKEIISNHDLYISLTPGAIEGEGAAFFMVGGKHENSLAQLKAINITHQSNEKYIKKWIFDFMDKNLPDGEQIDLLISGDNGDNNFTQFYSECEQLIKDRTGIARFKHLCGEYATAPAFALWLAVNIICKKISLPAHCYKRFAMSDNIQNILIYNCFQGAQHSLMLIRK